VSGGEVAIRPGRLEDAEGLQACLDAVARERDRIAMIEGPPLERVREFLGSLAERDVIHHVAVEGARVVGWCDLEPKPIEGYRHSATLGMGLLASHRGRGLGAALLRSVLKAAPPRGITRVELEVYPTNRPALALYERFDFVREGVKREARVLDGRRQDVLCMARLLAPCAGSAG